jgi:hypothetical protein
MFGIGMPELIILLVTAGIIVVPILVVIWTVKRVRRNT